jgi:hypothetical protein
LGLLVQELAQELARPVGWWAKPDQAPLCLTLSWRLGARGSWQRPQGQGVAPPWGPGPGPGRLATCLHCLPPALQGGCLRALSAGCSYVWSWVMGLGWLESMSYN